MKKSRSPLLLLSAAVSVLGAVLLCLFLFIPGSSTAAPSVHVDLISDFNTVSYNLKSDALSDIAPLRKRYRIPEESAAAPVPDEACFGEADSPAEVLSVIAASESFDELLEGQELLFSADTSIAPRSVIRYYCDETILSIVWQEIRYHSVFTFAEIKIADPSQLRRALAGNEYGSEIRLTPSALSGSVHAVTAINGDFYAHRVHGIVVYQHQLYRCETEKLDTCYFTDKGEMLMTRAGEMESEEQVGQFVRDNGVRFALSFGPILVQDGIMNPNPLRYCIGQPMGHFARSAIGTLAPLHYVLMTANSKGVNNRLINLAETAECMYSLGCESAYALDGGQTAAICMRDVCINPVQFGHERTTSDILYFATALPDERR